MGFNVNKDGTVTLVPDNEEIREACKAILRAIDGFDDGDAMYSLVYSMLIHGFVQMKMPPATVESLIELLAKHLCLSILGEESDSDVKKA